MVDGFGRYGLLDTAEGGEEVRCHECGATRRSLGTHANQVHGLTAAYRAAHGLPAATSLAAPATRRREHRRPGHD